MKDNTVLVLGAGASKPYGFPLGQELRELILRDAVLAPATDGNRYPRTALSQSLLGTKIGLSRMEEFRDALAAAVNDHDTMDAFLEDREDLRDIGTHCIAFTLKSFEKDKPLKPASDWYPLLYRSLELKKHEEPPKIRAIISFNYDRSLERFLDIAVGATHTSDKRKKIQRKLDLVKIIHVHGQLGDYPSTPYNPTDKLSDANALTTSLLFAHENAEHSPSVLDAREYIQKASQVVFLGFGYDERNIRRIGADQLSITTAIRGTTYGYPDERDLKRIKGYFRRDSSSTSVDLDPQRRKIKEYFAFIDQEEYVNPLLSRVAT